MTRVRRSQGRRGLTIIPALVCLMIVVLFASILINQANTQRGLARDEARRVQAEWLAESALARAKARLAAERTYRGETWEIPASQLAGAPGQATIQVDADAAKPAGRRVRVHAVYPTNAEPRGSVTKTLELTLDLGTERPGGSS